MGKLSPFKTPINRVNKYFSIRVMSDLLSRAHVAAVRKAAAGERVTQRAVREMTCPCWS